jgi:hypothetical protein
MNYADGWLHKMQTKIRPYVLIPGVNPHKMLKKYPKLQKGSISSGKKNLTVKLKR